MGVAPLILMAPLARLPPCATMMQLSACLFNVDFGFSLEALHCSKCNQLTANSDTMSSTESILLIGGTRGLGAEIAKQYAAKSDKTVYATSRSSSPPEDKLHDSITWIPGIDVASETVGTDLVRLYPL